VPRNKHFIALKLQYSVLMSLEGKLLLIDAIFH